MTGLSICHYPRDLVLRKRARKISHVDGSIQRLIDDMIETMQAANGVGLAAPQVGESLRLIIVQMPWDDPVTLINPEIVKRSGEQMVTEGCLSVPGYYGVIKRSASVVVKGKDRNWKFTTIRADGLMAEALEHEIDHLEGKLYIDHIESMTNLHTVKVAQQAASGTLVKNAAEGPYDYEMPAV